MSLPERHKKKATPVALVLSILFHVLLIGGLVYLAAREGVLGPQLRTLVAVAVPEEKKKTEPQKPKEDPKPAPLKETAKVPEARPTVVPPPGNASAPAPAAVETSTAPPPAIGPDFEFEGGASFASKSDPIEIYRGSVQRAFRSKWAKPDEMDDSQFAVEVDVTITKEGKVGPSQWRQGSGNDKWDASVRQALDAVKEIGLKPPKGFPERFVVRFDAVAAEPVN